MGRRKAEEQERPVQRQLKVSFGGREARFWRHRSARAVQVVGIGQCLAHHAVASARAGYAESPVPAVLPLGSVGTS